MCGIVGIAARDRVADAPWLEAAREALTHRGPDAFGTWCAPDDRVRFAHLRLAIIDLSPAGNQPMLNASGSACVVFNGEIYNHLDLRRELAAAGHRFRTESDTEALLAAYDEWGVDCLPRLNGMFAFAIYDMKARRLFVARDRAGEKPLYYTEPRGQFRFASEIKALLADATLSRQIDEHSLDCYLAEGFVPQARTMFRDVRKLPPAHAATFDADSGQSRIWRYWEPPTPPVARGDESQLVEELEGLLSDAVRRQLVADVPVGVLLSGGIDSSLVAAMATRAVPKVKTFTVRFPGHGRFDETEHARLVANHLGTDHVELEASPTSVELLPKLARQFDEPLIDSSMVPTYLVTRLVREHCTVALGGDGADELFGGYSHYDRLLQLQSKFGSLPRTLRRAVAGAGAALLPLGWKGRNWLQALTTDMRTSVPLIAQYFDRRSRLQLMSAHERWATVAEGVLEGRQPRHGDLLERATRLDFDAYLPEDILVKVDRTSMLNSLEVRAPMLDVRILEFALGKVPSQLKATATARKIILRRLAARVLPPEFNLARKQGFSIPLGSWLSSGPWLKYFREVLLDPAQTTFNHALIQAQFAGLERGHANGERLFGLLMFELWRRAYGARF